MANEVTIKVKADADGLSGQIKAAVDVAAASPFNVKIAASVTGTAEAVTKAIAEARVEAARAGIEFRASVALDKDSDPKNFATKYMESLAAAFGGGSGGGGIMAGIGSLLASPAGLAVAIPIVAGLSSAIEALAGIVPIAAAGMAALLVAGVTLKIGMSGITEAVTAYITAQDAANGKTAQLAAQHLSTSNSIISADLAVRNSRQALGDAYRNTANTIITAQEAVGNAQQAQVNQVRNATAAVDSALNSQASAYRQLQNAEDAEARAQMGVIDAKESASRALEDSSNKVVDTANAHQQAILNLRNAQGALFAPQSSTGPPRDIAQLSLAVREAHQRVIETQQAWDRAGADATKASERGVDGSKQVISAQDALKSAINSVASAQQAIGTANEQLARTYIANDVAKGNADQRLGDAMRALQQAQINGDEQIQRAKEGVNTALRAQQQTLAQTAASAESAAGSLAMYNAKLSELAPSAQGAVMAITGLYETWKTLRGAVQQSLFEGAGAGIREIGAVVLPVLQAGLVRVASALNAVGSAFTAWLTSRDAVRDLGALFGYVADAIRNLAPAIKPVMQIIMDLITVAASFLPDLATGFSNAAQSAADFIRHARDSGKLKEWMQSGLDAIAALWRIAKDLVGIFGDLAKSKGPSASFLQDIASLVHDIRQLVDFIVPVLRFFNSLNDATQRLGASLRASNPFMALWEGFKWVVNSIASAWNAISFDVPSINILGWHTPSFHWQVPQLPHWMATGGIGSGLTVVGESGPELVNLGAGSQVSSAANTQTTLAGMSNQPQTITLRVDSSGASTFEATMAEFIRTHVRVVGGGNVQRAFT